MANPELIGTAAGLTTLGIGYEGIRWSFLHNRPEARLRNSEGREAVRQSAPFALGRHYAHEFNLLYEKRHPEFTLYPWLIKQKMKQADMWESEESGDVTIKDSKLQRSGTDVFMIIRSLSPSAYPMHFLRVPFYETNRIVSPQLGPDKGMNLVVISTEHGAQNLHVKPIYSVTGLVQSGWTVPFEKEDEIYKFPTIEERLSEAPRNTPQMDPSDD